MKTSTGIGIPGRDGEFNHLFVHPIENREVGEGKDNMPNETLRFPAAATVRWRWRFHLAPDASASYMCAKEIGTAYATSTNTDLYEYDVQKRCNRKPDRGNAGLRYPSRDYSSTGVPVWLSMKRDGYEADKNDIIVRNGNVTTNLTTVGRNRKRFCMECWFKEDIFQCTGWRNNFNCSRWTTPASLKNADRYRLQKAISRWLHWSVSLEIWWSLHWYESCCGNLFRESFERGNETTHAH